MNKQLQEAQELEETIVYAESQNHNVVVKELLNQAKSNLESLGCGKEIIIEYKGLAIGVTCGNSNFKYILPLCPDCLAKGVDKAKEIYERILK